MKNTTDRLGERLRGERLRCNMTQAQLAEGIVSRNMLCMIESGRALPSPETVCALADRLEIPIGILFADDGETALYTKAASVSKAKSLFSEGKYSECADVCSTVHFDDEMTALMAECFLCEAKADMKNCMLASATRHLKSALEVSRNTIYLDDSFRGTIEAYLFIISCAANRIDSEKLSKICRTENRLAPSVFFYLSILAKLDRGNYEDVENLSVISSFLTKDSLAYLKAKKLLRDLNFTKALEVLLNLEVSKTLDFITKYRVYADIELCYENKRDFENAYKYSTLKHRTLECFRN